MILLILLLAYILIDTLRLTYYRKKIKYVIHVNGIRGKSSIVKHLDQIFRSAGYSTYSKITGTLPYVIETSGEKSLIKRRGPARIIEQKKFLIKAAKSGADVFICECMALRKESQYISEQFLSSDIGIISNVRTDHLEVMGYEHHHIANHLKAMRPKKGKLIVGQPSLLDDQAILGQTDRLIKGIYQQNLGILVKVLETLELDKNLIDHLEVQNNDLWINHKDIRLMSAFTANDLETTLDLYSEYSQSVKDKVVWFNNRQDRPIRQKLFVQWLNTLENVKIYITGDQKRLIEKQLHHVIDKIEPGMEIFGFGNIKGLEFLLDD